MEPTRTDWAPLDVLKRELRQGFSPNPAAHSMWQRGEVVASVAQSPNVLRSHSGREKQIALARERRGIGLPAIAAVDGVGFSGRLMRADYRALPVIASCGAHCVKRSSCGISSQSLLDPTRWVPQSRLLAARSCLPSVDHAFDSREALLQRLGVTRPTLRARVENRVLASCEHH